MSHTPHPPSALHHLRELSGELAARTPAVFLDYDGTLTPIVDRPELARLSAAMRATLRHLAACCFVAVVSGRDRKDVERLVGLDMLIYAGSHGFDIAGPNGVTMQHPAGDEVVGQLEDAAAQLRQMLGQVPGVLVELKRYALAVHFRLVADTDVPAVRQAVETVVLSTPGLRITSGKKIFELRPRFEWDKGKAVLWLMDAFSLDAQTTLPLYLGDDSTDEDAFVALESIGVGILVGPHPDDGSKARFTLANTEEVREFLEYLVGEVGRRPGRPTG